MFIDNIELWPHWILWLDWCFYAYKLEYFLFTGISIIVWIGISIEKFQLNLKTFTMKSGFQYVLVGCIIWIIYCLYYQGFALG